MFSSRSHASYATQCNVKKKSEIRSESVACVVRQSLFGQAPLYLADDCYLMSDSTRRSLWSAEVPTCVAPRTLSSYGEGTFAAAGPRLWNYLPAQLPIQTVQTTAELTPFSGSMNTALCDF